MYLYTLCLHWSRSSSILKRKASYFEVNAACAMCHPSRDVSSQAFPDFKKAHNYAQGEGLGTEANCHYTYYRWDTYEGEGKGRENQQEEDKNTLHIDIHVKQVTLHTQSYKVHCHTWRICTHVYMYIYKYIHVYVHICAYQGSIQGGGVEASPVNTPTYPSNIQASPPLACSLFDFISGNVKFKISWTPYSAQY